LLYGHQGKKQQWILSADGSRTLTEHKCATAAG